MNPLSYAAALISPAMQGVSQAAAGGADFLQALLARDTSSAAAAPPSPAPFADQFDSDPNVSDLQRLIAEELRRGGYADALPLEITDDGFGELRVESDHPERRAMERLLTAHPLIAHQFGGLRSSVEFTSTLRVTIPAQAAFEFSA